MERPKKGQVGKKTRNVAYLWGARIRFSNSRPESITGNHPFACLLFVSRFIILWEGGAPVFSTRHSLEDHGNILLDVGAQPINPLLVAIYFIPLLFVTSKGVSVSCCD